MPATITLTEIDRVDHNDAEEAGFESGYRWQLEDELGEVESHAPDRDAALDAATVAAVARGADPTTLNLEG